MFLLVLKYFLIFFGVRVFFQSSWNAIEFYTIKHPFSVLSAFMSAFVWTTFRTWKMTTRTFVVHTITEILFAKLHDSLFVVDIHVFAWKIIREVTHHAYNNTMWKIREINKWNFNSTILLQFRKIFRQINALVTYLLKPLLSRNFCQKCVRENDRNFHTVILRNNFNAPKSSSIWRNFFTSKELQCNVIQTYIFVISMMKIQKGLFLRLSCLTPLLKSPQWCRSTKKNWAKIGPEIAKLDIYHWFHEIFRSSI